MLNKDVVIGIDTSNYTTSLAIMCIDGGLVANLKRPLAVKGGEHGLRQSDAVFAHIKNIPDIMRDAERLLEGRKPLAVGVSTRPRNQNGSYMPCFLSGVSAATAISSMLGIPLYEFSHQCGHIMAALYSSGKQELVNREFCALHISGGTTEILKVSGFYDGFECEIVGGTRDASVGQIIDRVGVMMDMPFPAGPHIENAALMCDSKIPKKKTSVVGCYANFSGLENIARSLYKEKADKSLTSAFLIDYVGNSLAEMCDNYIQSYGEMPIVFAGGVMSNRILKEKLSCRFDAYFAEPAFSSDNAVGIAALSLLKLNNR